MQLKQLTNEELNAKLKSLVQREREMLTEILWHLKEVDRRQLYLQMGYSSLFVYMTENLGYSAASSQRRIDAARLLNEIPEVSDMIESGKINLSQVSLVQHAAREVRKSRHEQTSAARKKEILFQLQSKTHKESQVLVAQSLDLQLVQAPVKKYQADESLHIELTLTREQLEKVQQMQEILSNSVDSNDLAKVLVYLAEKVIQKRMGKTTTRKFGPSLSKENARRNNISVETKRALFSKYSCCQFQDKSTGRICGERRHLQIEHIRPVWANGSDDLSNLTVYCANHNKFTYRHQAHIRRL